MSRRAVLAVGAAAATGTAVAAILGRFGSPEPPEVASQLTASSHDDDIPLVDDGGPGPWRRTQGILVPLQPQQIVAPMLHEASLDMLEVRAIANDSELAFLLEWDDPDRDDLNGIGRFQDAVAIQLPSRAGETPPITMGAPGSAVHILQWRASWQRDIDRGRTGPQVLYPRLVLDVMPTDILPADAALPYTPGRAVDNPLSRAERSSPIEEIVAEGFGSATTLTTQRSRGAGTYANGRWSVTIAVPRDRGDAGDPIEPGSTWPVAFAAWLGSRGNRGARKHFADWVSVHVEAA